MLVHVEQAKVCDVVGRRQARRETEIERNQKLNDKSGMTAEMSSSLHAAAERIGELRSGRTKVPTDYCAKDNLSVHILSLIIYNKRRRQKQSDVNRTSWSLLVVLISFVTVIDRACSGDLHN